MHEKTGLKPKRHSPHLLSYLVLYQEPAADHWQPWQPGLGWDLSKFSFFFLIFFDAFSLRFDSSKQTIFLCTFSLLHTSVSCFVKLLLSQMWFQAFSKLPLRCPLRLPDTCFLTFLEMSFAVLLVSDFVSTPIALKQQFGFPPLPLLATCGRLMMRNMFSFTARTLRWFLSAGSTRSYFHRQDPSAFLQQETTNFIISFMNLSYFMNRRAVILLDWRPFSCRPCKPYLTLAPCFKKWQVCKPL